MNAIPGHWIEAAKISKKIIKDFFSNISSSDFLIWTRYNKYRYQNKGKYPILVEIRHTKHWQCYCDYDKDYIKINVTSSIFYDEEDNFSTKSWKEKLITIIVHEITHYFQHYFNVANCLSDAELQYYSLPGYGETTSDTKMFLYVTNWMEMDADLSALHYIKKYKEITIRDLEDYYLAQVSYNMNMVKAVARYVYDYWWKDNKDLEYRKKVETKEIRFS